MNRNSQANVTSPPLSLNIIYRKKLSEIYCISQNEDVAIKCIEADWINASY